MLHSSAASELWGGAASAGWFGRAADALGSPAVRGAGEVLGRTAAVVGIGADVATGVERAVDGDGWGAARSAMSAGGGVAMLIGGPVTATVGAVVVAGILVYEHREAIGRAAVAAGRGVARASRGAREAAADTIRANRRVAGALADEAREVGQAVGGVLSGARELVGGLSPRPVVSTS